MNEPVVEKIDCVTKSLADLLVAKNTKYGNSALEPLRVFAAAELNATQGICQRLDDKLGRIKNSHHLRKNDVVDIMGYLVLLCVAEGWTNFDELID